MRFFWTFMPGEADHVVLAQRLEVNRLDVLVDEGDVVPLGERRKRGQRAGDHGAALVSRVERQGVIETPVRRLEFGIDETDRKPACWGRH